MIKLSLIIPSYNMVSKIDACLESIYSQNVDEKLFEVVIADTSTDCSAEIYRKWATKHNNLKLIFGKKRALCGTARNIAFSQSNGQYVYFIDIDDRLAANSLQKVIDGLQSSKDIYFCPFITLKDNNLLKMKTENIEDFSKVPVAVWCKIYKREKFVQFPDYMPEDVVQNFLVMDRCQTFGYFDFPVYIYDNTNQNTGAISRTFDFLRCRNLNLFDMAINNTIPNNNLRDEYVYGVIRNIADMYYLRNKIKNDVVKYAYLMKLKQEYMNFMQGAYVH